MYASVFQQMPGSSAFKQTELSNMMTDDEDKSALDAFRNFNTLTKQFGFGAWPWVEWTLGMTGIYGPDWYPRDVSSVYTPYVNWAAHEVLGYDKGFDVDTLMREFVPKIFNMLFEPLAKN
jgi:hypothetical protein